MSKVLSYVFPKTLPVLMGYFVLGTAYGILMEAGNYGFIFTLLSSLLFFAGSAQYLAIGFLAAGTHPFYAFIAFFMLNARHIFYGISMLKPYHGIHSKMKKLYAVFALTDEAFSILHDLKIPDSLSSDDVYVTLSFIQHIYWILFGMFGYVLSTSFTLNIDGLDFVLTAMFLVIFVDQFQKKYTRKLMLLGLFASILALVLVGPEQFLLLAMLLILCVVTLFKKTFAREVLQ